MTVIDIALICIIIYIICFIILRHIEGEPCDTDEKIALIIGSLGISLLVIGGIIILGALIYGLWTAPWYDWFHNKIL